jgi:hypothetical protein
MTIETALAIFVPLIALMFTAMSFSRNKHHDTSAEATERANLAAEVAVDTAFGINYRVGKTFAVGLHCYCVLWAAVLTGSTAAAVFFGEINLFHKKTP